MTQTLTPFQSAEQSDSLTVKATEREAVLRFILANHPKRRIRLFSLPATQWKLESELLARARHKVEVIIGVERDKAVYQIAQDKRPEALTEHHHGDAAVLLKSSIRDVTALWFDAMGVLTGKDYRETIRALPKALDLSARVPAVFTFLSGRDDMSAYSKTGTCAGKRIRFLVRELRVVGIDVDVRDYREYTSVVGSPMVNVFALLTRRQTAAKGQTPNKLNVLTKKELGYVLDSFTAKDISDATGYTIHASSNWRIWPPDSIAQIELRKAFIASGRKPTRDKTKSPAQRAHETRRKAREREERKMSALPSVIHALSTALVCRKASKRNELLAQAKAKLDKMVG